MFIYSKTKSHSLSFLQIKPRKLIEFVWMQICYRASWWIIQIYTQWEKAFYRRVAICVNLWENITNLLRNWYFPCMFCINQQSKFSSIFEVSMQTIISLRLYLILFSIKSVFFQECIYLYVTGSCRLGFWILRLVSHYLQSTINLNHLMELITQIQNWANKSCILSNHAQTNRRR